MTRKIHVLHLIDHVLSVYGGTEQHLIWLQNTLDRQQFELSCMVFSKMRCPPETFPVQPPVLGEIFGLGKISYLKRIWALSRYLCDNDIDLIHAFTPTDEPIACYASLLARRKARKKIPVVGHRRNIGFSLNRKVLWKGRLTRPFGMRYIANSQAAVDAASEKEGIPRERFTVIHNPVSMARFEAGMASRLTRPELGLDSDAFVIGSVASLRPIKGHKTLLQALRLVVDKYPQTRLLCIGKQHEIEFFEELQALTAELDLERHVIWFGNIDNPFRVLPNFDLAVLASYSESFSNAILEYGVAGLPIVASNVGGMAEIITDGENGFLVPPEQSEILAEKMIQLIENQEIRKTVAHCIAETVRKNFDETVILKKYADFYKNIALANS